MAKYTMELRELLERNRDIFNFNYDFYDESERPKFERDFIRHFYFREICTENPEKFLWLLEDKMNTVFPYYNELFKATKIEYSVLDNYYMKEKTTRNQEKQGHSSGVSSNVAQSFDTQTTDSTDSTRDSSELTKTRTSKTEGTESATSINTGSVEGSGSKSGSPKTEITEDVSKKFLDTPQGSVDINDANYITTLNADKREQLTESTIDEKSISSQSTRDSGQADRDTSSETTESDFTTGSGQKNTTGRVDVEGEHRTTADNNTRVNTEDSEREILETERRGNIGVDADADLIQKHIKLQQILKKISLMFFDECEDLFMGLY